MRGVRELPAACRGVPTMGGDNALPDSAFDTLHEVSVRNAGTGLVSPDRHGHGALLGDGVGGTCTGPARFRNRGRAPREVSEAAMLDVVLRRDRGGQLAHGPVRGGVRTDGARLGVRTPASDRRS